MGRLLLLCMEPIWPMLCDHLKSDLKWGQFQNLFILGMFPFHTASPGLFPKLLLQTKSSSAHQASCQKQCDRRAPRALFPGPHPAAASRAGPLVHFPVCLLTSPGTDLPLWPREGDSRRLDARGIFSSSPEGKLSPDAPTIPRLINLQGAK